MKRIWMISMMALITGMVVKAEDNHLYIQPNAGETLDWSLPTLQKMTFQDGQVVLAKKDGTTAYVPIATVNRMFISTPSVHGIDVVETASPCTWQGELLCVNAPQGTSVMVYNVAGTLVIQQSLNGNSIDFHKLPKGVYIVNVGGQVFKTIKK